MLDGVVLAQNVFHFRVLNIIDWRLSIFVLDSWIGAIRQQRFCRFKRAFHFPEVAGAPVFVTARCSGVDLVFLSMTNVRQVSDLVQRLSLLAPR